MAMVFLAGPLCPIRHDTHHVMQYGLSLNILLCKGIK